MGPPQTVNGKFSGTSQVDKTKDGVSIADCYNHCKKEGFLYFGLQYGGACRCSNTYGSKGEDAGTCEMACFQHPDSGDKCGGAFRNSVFEITQEAGLDSDYETCKYFWRIYFLNVFYDY